MRARYYEATSGRFVSEDSQRSGDNWFAFASDNPANCSDPTGRFTWPIQVLNEFFALMDFMKALPNASAGQVEGLWSTFIAAFQPGYASLGFNIIADARREAKLVMIVLVEAGLATGSSAMFLAGYIIGTLAEGANLGAQSAMLAIGYDLRLQWYINDIDNC